MAIETLFGPSIADVQELRRQQQEREIAGAGGQFGVFAPLYQASLRFGNQAVQGMNTLLGAQDPMLKKATAVQDVLSKYASEDPSNPVTLEKIGRDLMPVAPDAGLKALTLAKQLVKERKLTTVAPGATVLNERGEVVFTAPEPDKDKTPQTEAERAKLTSLYEKYPNTVAGRAQAANEFAEWKSSFRQREAAAGVPESGQVKITDIATAQTVVDRYVKDPKDKLTTVNNARTQLALAFKGEGAALPQLQRQLVKLVGDSQIGQGEVRDALGSAGIVSDTISAVNKFMTGVPTQDKLKSVEQVIDALEDINARSFNQGRKQAEQVVGEAKFSEQTRKTLIPPEYKTAKQKKQGKFIEGRVYTDAKGNRARYVDGQWEPVQ
jgi:hypothetical protein